MKLGVLIGGGAAVVVLAVIGAGLAGLVHLPFLPKGLHVSLGHAAPVPVLVAVPSIVTNLAGADSAHFAQVAMTLQLADNTDAQTLTKREAAVENALLSDVRGESLAALGGSDGMAVLRGAVEVSLDRVLGARGAVQAVFFTQFIVQ